LFTDCTALTTLTSGFSSCTGLTTLPAGLFTDCTALAYISYLFEYTIITSISGTLFENCPITEAVYTFRATPIVAVPSGLFANKNNMYQMQYCFNNCVDLVTVADDWFTYSGNSLRNLSFVFQGCVSLISINFVSLANQTVYLQSMQQFLRGCTALEHAVIDFSGVNNSYNITNTFSALLYDCPNLKTVELLFSDNSRFNMTETLRTGVENSVLEWIVMDKPTPPAFSGAFMGITSNFIIYVPDASLAAYKAASGWSGYAGQIKPISEKP